MLLSAPVHIVPHELELRAQAVSVHLNLVTAFVQAEFESHLARLQRVHIRSVHRQHFAQPLHLQVPPK